MTKVSDAGAPPAIPQENGDGRVLFTVGKVDAGLALLLTEDQQLVEFPSILLPRGIESGAMVHVTLSRDTAREEEKQRAFQRLQEEILEEFSKPPEAPVISLRRATPTSLAIEWQPLQLHRADLKRVKALRNGTPAHFVWLNETSIRLHGLQVETEYQVQIQCITTAGIVSSNLLKCLTHSLNDLSGLYVAFDGFSDVQPQHIKELRELKELLKKLGASCAEEISAEVTHLVCRESTIVPPTSTPASPNAASPAKPTSPSPTPAAASPVAAENTIIVEANGLSKVENAKALNIPIVTPEWVRACFLQKKIKNASEFYAFKTAAR